MNKIVVTGGMGYIGSHTIVEILRRKNCEVISIDNFINSKPITVQRIHSACGIRVKNHNLDLCDLPKLLRFFKSVGKISAVIHFAALKSVEESMSESLRYYRNNVTSLINILECCREYKIPHFIYSSSCSIYGDIPLELQPVDEETPPLPTQSPYAHTKWIGEEILQRVYSGMGLKAVSLRYFNPAGADPSGHIGEDPGKEARNLVNVLTRAATKKSKQKSKPKISIFGNDYPTRDGTCIRDYIHVNDIAQAHLEALNYLEKIKKTPTGHYEVFNLGSGRGVTVLEMVRAFEEVSGIALTKIFSPRRQGDVVSIYSGGLKSRRILGWEPQYGIKDMVKSAWDWELGKGR